MAGRGIAIRKTVIAVFIINFLFDSWFYWLLVLVLALWVARHVSNALMMREWRQGEVPDATEFAGVYRVYMLPRWLFFWFRNVKVIDSKGEVSREGFNIAFGRWKWGNFLTIDWRGVCFDYSKSYRGSRFPFKLIIDFVQRLPHGIYLGRFCLRFWGRVWFVCWFLLKREHRQSRRVDGCQGERKPRSAKFPLVGDIKRRFGLK